MGLGVGLLARRPRHLPPVMREIGSAGGGRGGRIRFVEDLTSDVRLHRGKHRSIDVIEEIDRQKQRQRNDRAPSERCGVVATLIGKFRGRRVGIHFGLHAANHRQRRAKCKTESPGLLQGILRCNDPDGIRTRVAALKGPCPRPLDDGAVEGDVTPRGYLRGCPGGRRIWSIQRLRQ